MNKKIKKAAIGRPPKKAVDRRTNVLRIRLTAEERERVDAGACGADVSTWAREVLLEVAKRATKGT